MDRVAGAGLSGAKEAPGFRGSALQPRPPINLSIADRALAAACPLHGGGPGFRSQQFRIFHQQPRNVFQDQRRMIHTLRQFSEERPCLADKIRLDFKKANSGASPD